MKKITYKTGDIINRLMFIKEVDPHKSLSRNTRKALFKCHCGKMFEAIIRSVISGNTKSCGCYKTSSTIKRFRKHGLRNHPVYKIWCGIKTRCYNKKRIDYKYYGGMGIELSDEFHDFKLFYDYVTNLPDYERREELKLTIDRVNSKLNYQRNNLRWATRKQQSLNQRRNSGY
jgi:hypothetical protein